MRAGAWVRAFMHMYIVCFLLHVLARPLLVAGALTHDKMQRTPMYVYI